MDDSKIFRLSLRKLSCWVLKLFKSKGKLLRSMLPIWWSTLENWCFDALLVYYCLATTGCATLRAGGFVLEDASCLPRLRFNLISYFIFWILSFDWTVSFISFWSNNLGLGCLWLCWPVAVFQLYQLLFISSQHILWIRLNYFIYFSCYWCNFF